MWGNCFVPHRADRSVSKAPWCFARSTTAALACSSSEQGPRPGSPGPIAPTPPRCAQPAGETAGQGALSPRVSCTCSGSDYRRPLTGAGGASVQDGRAPRQHSLSAHPPSEALGVRSSFCESPSHSKTPHLVQAGWGPLPEELGGCWLVARVPGDGEVLGSS